MKINIRNAFIYIFCFIILVYPFNYTIKSRLFLNSTITLICILFSFVGLFLLGKIKKFTKTHIFALIITFIVLGIQLYNNYYFKESSEGKVIYFSLYIFLPFIISLNEGAIKSFSTMIKFFCTEHIFGTFFVQIFKNFYIQSILPWLSSGTNNVAYYNLLSGFNPGLTMHYSTNGIYLSIATIFFFSKFISDKKKNDLIFTLLSVVALLLTGKRAHTLFTLMVCVSIYLFNSREKISKKIFNFSVGVLVGIVVIIIISMFVPQVLNVITRFQETIQKGEVLSGREKFYDLALELWEEHKMFGNGWGAFSYYFQIRMFSENEFVYSYLDAHNVYLQLLCECGVIGLVFFGLLALYIILKTGKLIALANNNLSYFNLLFSLGFQLFFLLYSFSGNPLYDIQCYCVYFICIGITLNYSNKLQIDKEKTI